MPADVETVVYNTRVPWHGLGFAVDQGMTAKEAIVEAGLDWEVECVEIYDEEEELLGNYRAVRRVPDKQIYCIATDMYTPVQNRDAFTFFDKVIGSKGAKYEIVGSIGKGARMWLLAKLDGVIKIAGDEIAKYLTLVSSHDTSLALQMFWTPIRIVCANTLAMAIPGDDKFYAKKTSPIDFRFMEAAELLGFANEYYEAWAEKATRLADQKLPEDKVQPLLNAAWGKDEGLEANDIYKRTRNKMERVMELVEVGRDTKWAYFNAIAEYVDWENEYRYSTTEDQPKEAQLKGCWFGSGATIKRRAWK